MNKQYTSEYIDQLTKTDDNNFNLALLALDPLEGIELDIKLR